jgi:hypothetical protein
MAFTHEVTGGGAAEAVGGAGNEDTGHGIIVAGGVLVPTGGALGLGYTRDADVVTGSRWFAAPGCRTTSDGMGSRRHVDESAAEPRFARR